MFLGRKNQYCENDYTTKCNLQIQCNPYQITNSIFHRARTKNFTIHMETQKTLNSQRCPHRARARAPSAHPSHPSSRWRVPTQASLTSMPPEVFLQMKRTWTLATPHLTYSISPPGSPVPETRAALSQTSHLPLERGSCSLSGRAGDECHRMSLLTARALEGIRMSVELTPHGSPTPGQGQLAPFRCCHFRG